MFKDNQNTPKHPCAVNYGESFVFYNFPFRRKLKIIEKYGITEEEFHEAALMAERYDAKPATVAKHLSGGYSLEEINCALIVRGEWGKDPRGGSKFPPSLKLILEFISFFYDWPDIDSDDVLGEMDDLGIDAIRMKEILVAGKATGRKDVRSFLDEEGELNI